MTATPYISVLIATHNRAESLMRLLASLDAAVREAGCAVEIVVANNGSSDDTLERLGAWRNDTSHQVLSSELPSKSKALNQARRVARGELLAFVDDDEEVPVEWLAAIAIFFAEHPEYAAGMGRVLPPRGLAQPEQLALAARYRTIAFFDGGDQVHDKTTLHGSNMVIRRNVLEAVGGFDERLGPGGSGAWEDVELGERLCRAGHRIAYMPGVATFHHVDVSRFTAEYFRRHNRAAGRSIAVVDPHAWRRSLPRSIEAGFAFAVAALRGDIDRREHARGRLIRHWTTVRSCWGLQA